MISIETDSEQTSRLKGSVEHYEAEECKKTLSDFVKNASGKNIHLDISGLESVSSIALSFLLGGLRAAREAECELHYENMPSALFNMARVSGIESILIEKK